MGIVAKQSSWNLVFIILGFAVGGLSKIFLMPHVLTGDQLGKLDLLVNHAMIISVILNFGFSNTIIKFFKAYELKGKAKELSFNLLVYPLILGGLVSLVLIFFPQLYSPLVEKSSQDFIEDSMWILMLTALSLTAFASLSAISSSYLKSVFPIFLIELFVRLVFIVGVILFYFDWISFPNLVLIYGAAYVLIALLIAISLRGRLSIKSSYFKSIEKKEWKDLFNYSSFALLDSGASKLVNLLDVLMIGLLMSAKFVAFYTMGMAISAVIKMSSRAISPIASPLVAKAWAENNHEEIQKIYHKSSLNQMIIGSLMFCAIWVSIDQIEMMLPVEFRHIKYVVFWLGIGNLLNVSAGINGNIIVNSSSYRVNLYLNSLLLALTYLFNVLLIPEYGIEGASLATCLSLGIFNLFKFLFLYRKWNFQPFTPKHLWVVLILLASVFVGEQMNGLLNGGIVELLVKLASISIMFCVTIYVSRISPDLNQTVQGVLKRFK